MLSPLAVALDTLTHICPCGSNSTLPPGRRCIFARKILTLQVTALLPLKCGTLKSAALLGVDTRPDAAVWGYGEVVGLISAGDGSVWSSTTSIRGQSDFEIFKVVLVWSGKNTIPPEYSSQSHTLLSWSWKKSKSYQSCRDCLQLSTHSQNTRKIATGVMYTARIVTASLPVLSRRTVPVVSFATCSSQQNSFSNWVVTASSTSS